MIDSPENIRASQNAMRELNAPFLTVLLEGRYLDSYLHAAGKDAPQSTDREMSAIGSRVDFVGLSIYAPTYICAADHTRRLCPASTAVFGAAHGFFVALCRSGDRLLGSPPSRRNLESKGYLLH